MRLFADACVSGGGLAAELMGHNRSPADEEASGVTAAGGGGCSAVAILPPVAWLLSSANIDVRQL